jgi:hypothetical protein
MLLILTVLYLYLAGLIVVVFWCGRISFSFFFCSPSPQDSLRSGVEGCDETDDAHGMLLLK